MTVQTPQGAPPPATHSSLHPAIHPSIHPRAASESEAILETIDLVTFDCFGTLVDWREALPALGCTADQMPIFLEESVKRQRPPRRGAPFVGYRTLLEEIGAMLRPDKSHEEITTWARGFGELPLFADALPSLRLLAQLTAVGVVSNCDAVHQLDVSRRIGVPWDIAVVAEEVEAYKPTDRAWDRAVALVERRGFQRSRWLHVSAWDDYDLAPAAARGIRTAFVPRPGGVPPTDHAVDHVFPDLIALARAIGRAKQGPFVYEVDAVASSPAMLERYEMWLVNEHLAEMRALTGVRSAELLILGPTTARATYLFSSRAAYARYLDRDAKRIREKARALFSEADVRFERREGTIVHAI